MRNRLTRVCKVAVSVCNRDEVTSTTSCNTIWSAFALTAGHREAVGLITSSWKFHISPFLISPSTPLNLTLWPYIIDELDTLLTLVPEDSSFLVILIFTWCSYLLQRFTCPSEPLVQTPLQIMRRGTWSSFSWTALHQEYWYNLSYSDI